VVRWADFEQEVPEIAGPGRERIELFDFVLIGTLRKDGSPRINPVEAYVVDGELTMNMMPQSRKALDLLRDPRVAVHTVVTRRDGDEGEFKIRGRALEVEDARLREAISDNFEAKIDWRPPDESHFFAIDIDSAAFVIYSESDQHMTLWTRERGVRQSVRPG
jgi:predicted pyridoxine 5'-phosphate oxidase superfamily flavin-nucleotide-binding protein